MAGEDEKRKIRFVGPDGLGPEPFLLTRFTGTEALGRLFEYEVDLLHKDPAIAFDKVIGQPVTIVIDADAHGPERLINGYISRFTQVDRHVNYMKYVATVVPFMWFLNGTAECRIMPPMKTIPDIVEDLLNDRGYHDVKRKLKSTYKPRPYCVQYRETDFNFISRLLEEEGIYYYFDHKRDGGKFKHEMVLCDDSTDHPTGGACEAMHFAQQRDDSTNSVADWTVMNHIHADHAYLVDYDFMHRQVLRASGQVAYPDLGNKKKEVAFLPPVGGDVIDFPSGIDSFDQQPDREELAKLRAEQAAVRRTIHRGFTTAHGLFPGVKFKVDGHPRVDQNSTYLVISASFSGWEVLAESGDEAGGGEPYTSAFEAIDANRHFRPARTTVKPVIAGAQTALVVGDQNNEIITDEYGRVRVKFHWDGTEKSGSKPETVSCLIRVAQVWAGNKWGAMFMPRVGHEVVVEFLEGDPDRPLITGRVYNGRAMPPYDPTTYASVSTLKSMTTTKDGHGFNEVRFEDKKGSEQLFINAQRQMDVRVGENMFETVGGSREEHIGKDDKGSLNVLVSADVNSHIVGGQFELIDKKLHQHVTAEVVEVFEANHTVAVTNRQTLNAKEIAIEAKDAVSVKGATVAVQGAQAASLKAGDVKIEGTQSITLKVGGNFVVLTTSGLFINGSMMFINTGGGPQPADAPLTISNPTIEEPIDAAEATSALSGEQVAPGSAGPGRKRVTREVQLQRAPDPHPGPPANPPPPGHVDPVKKFIDIKWVEKETFCGGPATLTGTTKEYPNDSTETAEICNVADGATVATASLAIRGNSYRQKVDVRDWLPRKSGADFEESRDEEAKAAGQKTPDPLKMKFIPSLDKTPCTLANRNGKVTSHFEMLAKNYVCQVIGDIKYVEGQMGLLIQLGDSVPKETKGNVGINFGTPNATVMSGTDWRFAKDTASGRVYWDGALPWKPVPPKWKDLPVGTKLFGIGIWRDGTKNKAEFDLTWPDNIPAEWTPEQRSSAKTTLATWTSNTQTAWTNKFDLRRNGCSSSAQSCCRYSVQISVSFNAAKASEKTKTTIVIGINDARSNSNAWSLGDTRPGLAPHEFGHHLGCPDEYAGAGSVDTTVNTDGATAGIDYKSMMGSVPSTGMAPVKARSFDVIKRHLADMISKQKSVTFTFNVVPHI